MQNASPEVTASVLPQYELVLSGGRLLFPSREAVFQLIRGVMDPEHPNTLEELSIVSLDGIRLTRHVARGGKVWCVPARLSSGEDGCEALGPAVIDVEIVPTIPHCSLISIIGLSIMYRLRRFIGGEFKIEVHIKKGAHVNCAEINKQLRDRERVEAAYENVAIIETIKACTTSPALLASGGPPSSP